MLHQLSRSLIRTSCGRVAHETAANTPGATCVLESPSHAYLGNKITIRLIINKEINQLMNSVAENWTVILPQPFRLLMFLWSHGEATGRPQRFIQGTRVGVNFSFAGLRRVEDDPHCPCSLQDIYCKTQAHEDPRLCSTGRSNWAGSLRWKLQSQNSGKVFGKVK